MKALEHGIVRLCQGVLWVTMAVIFLILAANTLIRYTYGGGLTWASELPELMFPWLVMAGVVLGAAHGSHITTSFLMGAMPPGIRRGVSIVIWLAVAGLYVTLTVATWRMLDIVADERTPILQVPGSVTYGCVMVGMAMLALLALASAWRVLRGEPAALVHHDEATAEVGVA
jgi:TRAP-type transport system small permease protein